MLKTRKNIFRILTVLLLAALIAASVPASALAQSFSAAVKSKSMKVYADAYGQQYLGALPKKSIVTVESYSGGVAKISYNGMTGYAKVSDMCSVASFATEAKVSSATRVYQQPSTASASVKVKAGVKLYVLAVSGSIAMVEKDGRVGYMSADKLTYLDQSQSVPAVKDEQTQIKDVIEQLPEDVSNKIPESVIEDLKKNDATKDELEALKKALEEEYVKNQDEKKEEKKDEKKDEVQNPAQTISVSVEEAFSSGKYSNEQLIYIYAVKKMGYSPAAAAGLLANIKVESGFRPTASGDSGSSYGICQWHAARKTRLINWCERKGTDYTTLAAQLAFLQYELETYYPAVHKYMKNVENSAQGAYDAGYYFCYNFEAPANRAGKSASRGNSAMNTYYPKYANYI